MTQGLFNLGQAKTLERSYFEHPPEGGRSELGYLDKHTTRAWIWTQKSISRSSGPALGGTQLMSGVRAQLELMSGVCSLGRA